MSRMTCLGCGKEDPIESSDLACDDTIWTYYCAECWQKECAKEVMEENKEALKMLADNTDDHLRDATK